MKIRYMLLIFIIILGCAMFFFSTKKAEDGRKNVVFWTLQMGTFDKYINNIIDKFEKENSDIKIIWVDVPYSEGEKRTLASMLSNNPPDLVNLTPEFSIILAQKKALYEISPETMDNYLPSISAALKFDNKYFGIPFYATSALTFYNKDLCKKAGIKNTPKTYDELYSYAKTAKFLTNSYITMPTLTENDTFLKILNKNNINSSDNISSDSSIKIFNQYKDLYQQSLIPKESITQTHREALEKYMAGQIIFFPAGANFLNIIKENAPKIYEVTDVSTQLTGTNGKYDFSLMNFIIPKKSKHPEEALRFAVFLTNETNQLELAKLTTVLPVNKNALKSNYFTTNTDKDLVSKARIISASQLSNIQLTTKQKNQKELLNLINNYVQQVILSKEDSKKLLEELSLKWGKL